MSARNWLRMLAAAFKSGDSVDTGGNTLQFLPAADDSGALNVGDGSTDIDVKVFLGSTTEYVDFNVGDSNVALTVPISTESDIDLADGGTVTQITSITTGVELNTHSGQITTVSSTLAAASEATFTVTNSKVAATDVIIAHLASTSSAGTPIAYVTAVAAGSFDVTIANLHASAALDNTMVINFGVIGGSAT